MTPQEILEYNKRCTQFLGYVYIPHQEATDRIKAGWWKSNPRKMSFNIKLHSHLFIGRSHKFLRFHSDWNWIMEVVEAIEKTNRINDKEYYPYCVTIWKNGCIVSDGNNGYKIIYQLSDSKQEAVVEAINQFLIWYNKQK